jgi:predicted nucleic acid-binding protein
MPLLAVVLDANALFPIALCDTLLRAAVEQLYRPFWSSEILGEVERNLITHHRATPELARRRCERMASALPGAMVTGYSAIIPLLTNDPKDRHVLATAIHAGAQLIVTRNIRDFPAVALGPYDIRAQAPDGFLQDLLESEPETVLRIIAEQAADLRRPSQSVDQVLARLALEVPGFVRAVRGKGFRAGHTEAPLPPR